MQDWREPYMIKNFIKKLMGLDKIESSINEKLQRLETLQQPAVQPVVLSVKEQATINKAPYVAITDTHINKDNVRNGFFELDWNEYFVLQLSENGYTGDSEEAIVDQWFQELCKTIGSESGVDMSRRSSGYIDTSKLADRTDSEK